MIFKKIIPRMAFVCMCWVALSTNAIAQEKLSGVVYFDYTNNNGNGAEVSNEFEMRRVYFTFEKKLTSDMKYKFQMDAGRLKGDDENGKIFAYIKKANISWHAPVGDITIGIQGMDVFSVQEKTWGYRFIEKSSMDRHKFSSSADLGIGYANKLGKDAHYSVLYTNGSGYAAPEIDGYKKISGLMLYGEPALSKHDGFNGGLSFSYEPFDNEVSPGNVSKESRSVFSLFGGYSSGAMRVGVELDNRMTGGTELTERIIGVYANYDLTERTSVFTYYDNFDGDSGKDLGGLNYLILGSVYQIGDGLRIAPNVRLNWRGGTGSEESTNVYNVNFEFRY